MQGSSRPDRTLLDSAALCRHLLAEGSVHALLAEHRGAVLPDELFEDLFPSGRGRPSVPADVIATVMVLQALEGLSDRQAVRRLETDISWKAAAGLALTDEAFHPTALVLWRDKAAGLRCPRAHLRRRPGRDHQSGVIAGKTRRALDSTVLDDAVARQDTITILVTQICRVRRLVPELARVWVREHNLEGGRPRCDWEDPADMERLISELVDDANELVWAAEDLDLDDTQAAAVALLGLVAGQDVEPGDGPARWRIAQRSAPGRVISTVDPESRQTHKWTAGRAQEPTVATRPRSRSRRLPASVASLRTGGGLRALRHPGGRERPPPRRKQCRSAAQSPRCDKYTGYG